METKRILYHGSREIVEVPEIRKAKFNKDFAAGFYCTVFKEQAIRWATRYPVAGYVNEFDYLEDKNLHILPAHQLQGFHKVRTVRR